VRDFASALATVDLLLPDSAKAEISDFIKATRGRYRAKIHRRYMAPA
jgi:hypothetical protein